MTKPPGYFERIFAFDVETSGLYFGYENPVTGSPVTGERGYYQTVSWGIQVLNASTLKVIDEVYIEQQWDGVSLWEPKAEAVHGLSKAYLAEHGKTRDEVAEIIANLVIKHWGKTSLVTLGHNSISFDLPFLKHEMDLSGIHLNVGNRHLDSNTIAFTLFGAFNSDDLFKELGFDARNAHNALDDIKMTVDAFRVAKQMIGVN